LLGERGANEGSGGDEGGGELHFGRDKVVRKKSEKIVVSEQELLSRFC
jgi:hypothetical protein